MEWVETTGRTVEEAKDLALDELGVDDQEAEFEIIDEGKAGLFGLVRREARVRARVRPTQPRPKVDRRRSRRRDGGEGSRTSTSKAGGKDGGKKATKPAGRASVKDSGKGDTEAAAKDAPQEGPKEGTDQPKAAGTNRRRRRPVAPAGAPGSETPVVSASTDKPAATKKDPKKDPTKDKDKETMDEITLDQQVEVMEDFLDGLVEAFGLDGTISSEEIDDDIVEIHIDGDDLGLLIGPKGQTLAAVQELSRTVAQRRLAGPHQGRVRMDVSGYRKRRAEALTRFAVQVAEDVKATGTPKVLEPMSPPDRKVVHDAVNGVDGVHTASEGEDHRRRVVVLPD